MTKNFRWWWMMAMGLMWFIFWIISSRPELMVISNMWIMGAMLTND